MVGIALLHVLPQAAAEHIQEMHGAQLAAAPDGTVVLAFSLTTRGAADGGELSWRTGDGASGHLWDGFEQGVFVGEGSGSGRLSDGRTFEWKRSGVQAPHGTNEMPHPGEVVITISYAYRQTGMYLVTWNNCCTEQTGRFPVFAVTDKAPDGISYYLPNCTWLDEDLGRCMMTAKTRALDPVKEVLA